MLSVCASCGTVNRVDVARAESASCGKCRSALPAPGHPREIVSADDFQRVVQASPIPVLVDFWASWCGPCRMAGPQVERLARERAEDVLVAKVDTEALPELAGSLKIRGIPTFVVFRNGKEVSRSSGYQPAEQLAQLAGI